MKVKFLKDLSFDNLNNYPIDKGTVCRAEYTNDDKIAIELPNKYTALAPKSAIGNEIEILD